MFKKVIIYAISILSAFSLTSCNGSKENTDISSTASNSQNVTTTAPWVTNVTLEDSPVQAETTTVATTITEAVATEPQTTTVATTVTEQITQTNTSESESVLNKIIQKAAPGSPLETGYGEYDSFMNRYYDLEHIDNGFNYKLNRDSVTLSSAWFLTESSGTITSVKSQNISGEDTEKFKRIYEYINAVAGEGNYSIHDAYTEQYQDEYSYTPDNITSHGCHIDIVLNSDLDKYKSATPADKHRFIVKFEIDDKDNALKSEYELHQAKKDYIETFINELNSTTTDMAFGVDDVFYSVSDIRNISYISSIHTPFRNPVKKSCENDNSSLSFRHGVEPYYHKPYQNSAFIPGEGILDSSKLELHSQISIYTVPGYDKEKIVEFLYEISPILEKYNVTTITSDVMKDENDITKFRNYNGYIPEQTIESSLRSYLANTPQSKFEVGGK